MEFGLAFWILAGLGVACAGAYGFYFLRKPPTLLRALVKTGFVGLLAAAFLTVETRAPIALALALCAAGDLFLAFDKKWTLPLGILAFLLAQLLYAFIFFALWMLAPDGSPLWPRYLAMGAIVVTTIGFLVWMGPKLGWMALGVVPYAIAITAMACMAMWLPWAGWPGMLGALSFVVSDFVLSAELFRLASDAPVRRVTAPVVWWTYAAAQMLIMNGIVWSAAVMV